MRTRFIQGVWPLCFSIMTFFLGSSRVLATVTFDWVTVGNPGNSADTLVMSKGPTADFTSGYGSVGYSFQISKTHVTNSQYVEFLNAADPDGIQGHPILGSNNGIYNRNMSISTIGGVGTAYTGGIDYSLAGSAGGHYSAKSGQENYPATWINWDSSARFVNWLHNGQGSGDTENGVYDMSIPRSTIGGPLPRQSGANYFIPSENEFYKAAYYDPTKGGTGGYWQYGVQSDSPPIGEAPPGGTTSANNAIAAGPPGSSGDIYWQTGSTFDSGVNYLRDVGSYASATSYYGLQDVDGQVFQWTEGVKQSSLGADFPVYRGGSWFYSSEFGGAALRALYSFRDVASYAWYGLRIAQPVTALEGDFDLDGDVDGRDFLVWQRNTSVGDLADWQNNYGMGSLVAARFSVPEPSSWVLLSLTAVAGKLARRRRITR